MPETHPPEKPSLDKIMQEVNRKYQDLEDRIRGREKGNPDLKKSTVYLLDVIDFLRYLVEHGARPEVQLLSEFDRNLLASFLDSRKRAALEYETMLAKEFARTDIKNGLCKDARNDWNDSVGAASMLIDMSNEGDKESVTSQRLLRILLRPRFTYREYFSKKYSPVVADVVVHYPKSDQEKISKYDELVKEYNDLAGKGMLDPEGVLNVTDRALELFETDKE